jgi:IS30 family transposase
MTTYKNLQPEERAFIMLVLEKEFSLTKIAEKLDRSPSTILREVQRQKSTQYIAKIAANRYRQQRKRCNKETNLVTVTPLFDKVRNILRYRQRSPEQISNRLRLDYPSDSKMQVSHECIYSSIYAFLKNEIKKVFISELRQHKAKRGAKKSTCFRFYEIFWTWCTR